MTWRETKRIGAALRGSDVHPLFLDTPCAKMRSWGGPCGELEVRVHDHGHAWCVSCGSSRTAELPPVQGPTR